MRIFVVPWEGEKGVYGVAWITTDGRNGLDRIGSKDDAEALVRDVTFDKAPPRPGAA